MEHVLFPKIYPRHERITYKNLRDVDFQLQPILVLPRQGHIPGREFVHDRGHGWRVRYLHDEDKVNQG